MQGRGVVPNLRQASVQGVRLLLRALSVSQTVQRKLPGEVLHQLKEEVMAKYIVGHCMGCGVLTAGAVFVDDNDRNMNNAMEILENGQTARILETTAPVTVGGCLCGRNK